MPIRAWGWLAALAAAIGIFWHWRSDERAAGAAEERAATSAAHADSLAALLGGMRERYRVDTVAFEKLVDHRDSLMAATGAPDSARAALDRVAHTPRARPETVTVRVPARVLVTDDSTIRACRETLSECGRVAQAERARADALQVEVTALKHVEPDFLGRHASFTAGYGVILQSGHVLAGPSLSVGVRIWP